MKNMQLLIKPASSECNLDCRYCFYKDEADKREQRSYGIMKEGVRDLIIEKTLSEAEDTCNFAFQGGEPTLAGLAYFKGFTDTVNRLKGNLKIDYSLQTNGTLLDEEWLDFLEENNFLVGISLDGTKAIHDKNRVDLSGSGTFLKVMDVMRRMKNRNIELHVLAVLTASSAMQIEKVYRFFQKEGFLRQQYIPCLDPLDQARGGEAYSLNPVQYGECMKKLFDMWMEDYKNHNYVYIRQFENWCGILKGCEPEACSMTGRCSVQNVVESNGDVYACDFYVLEKYRLGNLGEKSWREIWKEPETLRFFEESAQIRGECLKRCGECRWHALCRGGCLRDMEKDGENGWHNYYCEAYRNFFPYIMPRLGRI